MAPLSIIQSKQLLEQHCKTLRSVERYLLYSRVVPSEKKKIQNKSSNFIVADIRGVKKIRHKKFKHCEVLMSCEQVHVFFILNPIIFIF